MKQYFQKELYKIDPYVPGEQPGKNVKVIKLNTNENPYPPTPKAEKAVKDIFKKGLLRKYPNPVSAFLIKEIAKLHKVKETQVMVTNGSDEALALLFKASLSPKDKVLMPYPTYSLYPVLTDLQMNASSVVKVPLRKDFHFDFAALKKTKAKLLTFAYPNAPTGILEKKEHIIDLIANFDGLVLCDEAYIDFAPEGSSLLSEMHFLKNLIVTRTFSKSYSLAGLRAGYLISSEENVSLLMKLKDSYNLGMIEQEIALAALKDRKYLKKTITSIINSRKKMTEDLTNLSFYVIASDTNFLFVKPPEPFTAHQVFTHLKSKNIFIRYFKDEFCKDFIRITIGSESENKILIKEIQKLLKGTA